MRVLVELLLAGVLIVFLAAFFNWLFKEEK